MTSGPRGRLPAPSFWRDRRVLVTGHTGFKGSWLTAWLTEMDAEVAGLSLPDMPTSPSLWEVLGLAVSLDIRADVATDEWQPSVVEFDPHTIIHLAAQPLVTEGYNAPLRTFETNVIGTARVLELMSQLSSLESVLVATTDKVYDPDGERPYTESARLGGADPYSASKACAELLVRSWPAPPAPVVTARAGNVIGGGDWGSHRLLPDLVRSWSSGAAARIRQPSAVRPWQHVLEPLGGYLVYLERLAETNDLRKSMNFGPSADQAVPVRDVVAWAQREWARAFGLGGLPHCLENEGGTIPETAILEIDSSEAAAALDWSGRLDWRSAVSMTIDWYSAHAKEGDARAVLRRQLRQYADLDAEVGR